MHRYKAYYYKYSPTRCLFTFIREARKSTYMVLVNKPDLNTPIAAGRWGKHLEEDIETFKGEFICSARTAEELRKELKLILHLRGEL